MPTEKKKARSHREPPVQIRWPRVLFVIGGLAVLYVAGQFASDLIVEQFGFHLYPRQEPMLHRLIVTAIVCYIILIAIPFMPGVEIGLGLIAFLGPNICFLVYISTVFALALSYLIGRFIPTHLCAQAFGYVGLTKAQILLDRIEPLTVEQRLAYLSETAPPGILSFLFRHRYIALAMAVNLPGNILIGGGGGIAMFAGMSGIFPFPMFLLTILLAIAPVPLMITVTAQ